jgi:hypothetical protein
VVVGRGDDDQPAMAVRLRVGDDASILELRHDRVVGESELPGAPAVGEIPEGEVWLSEVREVARGHHAEHGVQVRMGDGAEEHAVIIQVT